jgi:flagellar protein FlaG
MTIDSAATTVVSPSAWPVPKPDKAIEFTRAAPAAAAPVQHETADAPPTADAVKAAVKQIESFLKDSGRSLEFTVDEATGHMVISVRDAASGDLIRQIPGEDALRVARALRNGSRSLMDLVV